jgi:hypothetical protein
MENKRKNAIYTKENALRKLRPILYKHVYLFIFLMYPSTAIVLQLIINLSTSKNIKSILTIK